MGASPENINIHVSVLVTLWVAQGFVKPVMSKGLEGVAEECSLDCIDRNSYFDF